MDGMDSFNKSGVDGRKESKQGIGGLEVTTSTTYKTPFVVHRQLVTVILALVYGVVCNTIFSWTFLKKLRLQ